MYEVEPDERLEQCEFSRSCQEYVVQAFWRPFKSQTPRRCVVQRPSGTVLLPESFWEASGKLPGNFGNLPAQPWHILFRVFRTAHFYELVFSFLFINFQKASRKLPGASTAAVISTLRLFFLLGMVSGKASRKLPRASGDAVKVDIFTPRKIAG